MPDPARVTDPTSDGGAVARGCDSVLIGGLPVARENDEVVTPKLGKGSIAQHARTVEVGGRLMAFTGHLCQKGGPGAAGLGNPDVLSMSSMDLLKAELAEARRRLDAGEAPPPKAEMRATPEKPAPGPGREHQRSVETDANGITTDRSSYGVDETNLAQGEVGGTQYDLTRTREGGITELATGDSATAAQYRAGTTGFQEEYALTLETAGGGPRTELTGGFVVGQGGAGYDASLYNAETQEIGPSGSIGVRGVLGGVFGGARVEVSALDALSGAVDPTGLGTRALEYFGLKGPRETLQALAPGLDDFTAEVGATAGLDAGAELGAEAKAVYDVDDARLEAAAGGELAVAGVDLFASIGRRRKGKEAIGGGGGEDVALAPVPSTVVVEGGQ